MKCGRSVRRLCRRLLNGLRRLALFWALPALKALDALELALERAGCPERLAARATQSCFFAGVALAGGSLAWTFWAYPVAAPPVLAVRASTTIIISYSFDALAYALLQCLGCIVLILLLAVHRTLAGLFTVCVYWPRALGVWTAACSICAWVDDDDEVE